MPQHANVRFFIDIPVEVGNGSNPKRDFALAVHLTLYWAQDLSQSAICNTASPPRRLAEKLRKGIPLPHETIEALGEGRWPPTDDALDVGRIPGNVPPTALREGQVEWTLSGDHLRVHKETHLGGSTYVNDVEVFAGSVVRVRHRVGRRGAAIPVPGTPRNLKLISAVCGIYDGGVRFLPRPMRADSPEDVEVFLAMLENTDRQQPIVAVAAPDGEPDLGWASEIAEYALKAFALQHVVTMTANGRRIANERLGRHGLQAGAIKTYNARFHMLDAQGAHPMTTPAAIGEHERGLTGMLDRWRKRLITRDAFERRDDYVT